MRSPRDILCDALTIAVVGASRYPEKTAHAVPYQLLQHGWRVIPVNPGVEEVTVRVRASPHEAGVIGTSGFIRRT